MPNRFRWTWLSAGCQVFPSAPSGRHCSGSPPALRRSSSPRGSTQGSARRDRNFSCFEPKKLPNPDSGMLANLHSGWSAACYSGRLLPSGGAPSGNAVSPGSLPVRGGLGNRIERLYLNLPQFWESSQSFLNRDIRKIEESFNF